jgi:hypothetical protein
MAENLYIGAHRSQNDRYDAGYIRTFYGRVYEHDLSKSDGDFSVVEAQLKKLGFDFGKKTDVALDGDVIIYGQRV